MKKLFTSESVTEGHPDKICDQISDGVLDEILKKDPTARVACECSTTTGLVLVMGEITTEAYVDIQKVARDTLKEIGYDDAHSGIDAETCAVITSINEQSPDIALGVDNSQEFKSGGEAFDIIGAGDQGMMFGYATDETKEYMPMALMLAHSLTRRLTQVRKDGTLDYLRPDGKSQVTVVYDDDKVVAIDTIVISTQHSENVKIEKLREDVKNFVINPTMPKDLMSKDTKIFINPTGRFEIGGPKGDSGLTGRKIIVDTYGGSCPHGGGAFSGKDPTKVDRSAAYMSRYVAKNVVASGLCRKCVIEVAYAIGVASPVSLYVNTFGTGIKSDDEIVEIIKKEFDFRPMAIIEKLDLRKPIYKKTASYGHFGRSEFSWEKLDAVDRLKKYL